ncbi:ATP-binding protein [Actinokineospora cianjurensis]|uniref:CO dehydrogenase maturation factor n=1 Tax=Actinokineospora cianjurensis TaxID=585224 RepID=A0A421AXI6_9PSEU|nr:ATP-binding protein [Actinokineospora cianjurensis]RLK54508.1 CO dehydrogenase maturation factor [Actinokineospora cianjurensis]
MKIAFVGKGGSGKTTLASLFLRHLAAETPAPPLLGIDADINQHLAAALGAGDDHQQPTLGEHMSVIKDHLRGDNPRVHSAGDMIKTTPPGRGSRLIGIDDDNPLYTRFVRVVDGVRLAATGPFTESDLGVSCYHSKVGAVELLLNHMVDGAGEYAVVDMTAGADSFASGLFTRFDVTFLVCEPTLRSVGVYRQYLDYARDFDVRVAVVGNKVIDADDVAFLRQHVGADLLTWIGRSDHVRAAERGDIRPVEQLEPANRDALRSMRALVDGVEQDWPKFHRQTVEFHLRNATAWANGRAGRDLADQVDPGFVPGPVSLAG